MITDSASETVYTILKDVSLSILASQMNQQHHVNAIEGRIVDYEINGVKEIELNNLDSDLRLYFTENNIAENGIFIKKTDDNS
ncbi:hypothetical protein [uncultured Clostridium sp.]|uniref:hypothetical protein n=1 Tax=uncultured Clostridium sp. TaxID=59620 RepID=UPI0026107591|nr:hypothetical protein [uncultured Clostridium sp.]